MSSFKIEKKYILIFPLVYTAVQGFILQAQYQLRWAHDWTGWVWLELIRFSFFCFLSLYFLCDAENDFSCFWITIIIWKILWRMLQFLPKHVCNVLFYMHLYFGYIVNTVCILMTSCMLGSFIEIKHTQSS